MRQVIKLIIQEVGLSTNNLYNISDSTVDKNAIVDNAISEYWYFARELDEKTCNKIIDLATEWQTAGVVNNLTDDSKPDTDIRVTDVTWCNEQWVYDLVWDYLNMANNNSNWNFQIDSCEAMQIARYNKKGHYDFHVDGNGITKFENNNKFTRGKTRKLSMSIVLNDDFEGGEFEFFNKAKINSKKGTVIVFPSYMLHRVKPVTKGTRYSLVTWFCGEPFR